MKKFILLLMVAVLATGVSAQRRVNAYCLTAQKQVAVQISYDKLVFDPSARLTPNDFADILAANRDAWNQSFMRILNEELSHVYKTAVLGEADGASLLVTLGTINDRGIMNAKVAIIDATGAERAVFTVYSRPGLHGGFVEFVNDCMERLAEATGETLVRSL